ALTQAFENLYHRYNRKQQHIDLDPVRYPRSYKDIHDQELVAFIAAMLSFGRVASIQTCLDAIFSSLGPQPLESVLAGTYRNDLGFSQYRWIRKPTILSMLDALQEIYRTYSSIEAFFLDCQTQSTENSLQSTLKVFSTRMRLIMKTHAGQSYSNREHHFLIAHPGSGSACKRMMMFLRWMIRKSFPDLGLWPSMKEDMLMIPLDTHMLQFASHLSLTQRKTPGWNLAQDVTDFFSTLSPEDPLRYDFALVRMGVEGDCRHQWVPTLCKACPIQSFCVYGTRH
ncbi:MAG: TIGR02757 family protein, partial [Bdellovibrionales bacterium]|nr:TIGR02757 family protein [Bdellovibrionales bacterium]